LLERLVERLASAQQCHAATRHDALGHRSASGISASSTRAFFSFISVFGCRADLEHRDAT
jgi:hypothetical protein